MITRRPKNLPITNSLSGTEYIEVWQDRPKKTLVGNLMNGSSTVAQVLNEIPAGAINGSNATFTTEFNFIPESLALRSNGIQQRIVDDYQTSGNNTIQLNFSPLAGEKLEVDYIKI